MEIFKYGKREHIESLISDGIIRIGTLFDFKNEEVHGQEIGDQKEGKLRIQGDIINNGPASNLARYQILRGFVDGEGFVGRVVITDSDIVSPDLFIFSSASGFSVDALKRWYRDPKAKYDACCRISSARLFCKALSRAIEHKAKFEGMVEVTYYDNSTPVDVHSPVAQLHPAQIKGGVNYGHHREIRAAWKPFGTAAIEPENLTVPDLVPYCSLEAVLTEEERAQIDRGKS